MLTRYQNQPKIQTMRLLLTLLLFTPLLLFANRGSSWEYLYDIGDSTNYWDKFNFWRYFLTSILSSAVVILGLYIQGSKFPKSQQEIGKIVEIVGYVIAAIFMLGPVINGFFLLWRIAVGLAIFIGGIWWYKREYPKTNN